jgi:hypothetical protein
MRTDTRGNGVLDQEKGSYYEHADEKDDETRMASSFTNLGWLLNVCFVTIEMPYTFVLLPKRDFSRWNPSITLDTSSTILEGDFPQVSPALDRVSWVVEAHVGNFNL